MNHRIHKRFAWVAALVLASASPLVAQPSQPSQPSQVAAQNTGEVYELRVAPAATQTAPSIGAWGAGSITTPQGTFSFTPSANVSVASSFETPYVVRNVPVQPLQGYDLAVNLLTIDQKVRGAYMGVGVEAPTAALRSQLQLPEGVGLVVNYVDEKGPSNGVIHQHDVLQKLDDQLLVNAEQLVTLVRLRAPGATAQVTLIRESKPMTVTVKLGEKDQPPLSSYTEWQPSVLKAAAVSPDQQAITAWTTAAGGNPALINSADGLRELGLWTVTATQPVATTLTTTANTLVLRDAFGPTRQSVLADGKLYVTSVVDDATLLAARASRAGPITIDDGETLTWLQRGPSGIELTVVDRASGKLTFKGPVGTDEQWQKVPEEIRRKFEGWKAVLEQAPKPPEKK